MDGRKKGRKEREDKDIHSYITRKHEEIIRKMTRITDQCMNRLIMEQKTIEN